MKKIGVLFGQERTFPMAFIEKVNSRNVESISAEPVMMDKVIQGMATGYSVVLDRISHAVPFYRAYLKNASLTGTAVINNPFWVNADEKFFSNSLAVTIGVPVPKTVIIPSRELPSTCTHESFGNMAYPLDWEYIFEYVGFPAFLKPCSGGGWKDVYRVTSQEDFFRKHAETGQLVMLLQEEIVYEEYYRCYCVGAKHVLIVNYEPSNPHHLRYNTEFHPTADKLQQIREIVIRLNQYLGYEFNSVEIAFRDGVPYAIDFCNPVPEVEAADIGESNFEWIVDMLSSYAIEKALTNEQGKGNFYWGEFIKQSVTKTVISN